MCQVSTTGLNIGDQKCLLNAWYLVLVSARERHGISGRFTSNGLKLKHRLQKKMIDEDEVPKEIVEVSKALETWIQSYYSEVRRAIRGLGKYRLAPEFLNFYIEPAMWVQWSKERSQHYEALLPCIPQVLEYSQPKSAGQNLGNSGKNKRRARLPEPELFIERADIDDVSENSFTPPVAKKKTSGSSKSFEQVCIQIKRLID